MITGILKLLGDQDPSIQILLGPPNSWETITGTPRLLGELARQMTLLVSLMRKNIPQKLFLGDARSQEITFIDFVKMHAGLGTCWLGGWLRRPWAENWRIGDRRFAEATTSGRRCREGVCAAQTVGSRDLAVSALAL